ncbi:hypothetical protein EPA93_18175 [Ktedonosporobacter rubrisoli]|uniref:Uncharacterized protein n=1 Tax=Ktedonosporobacter rubrisoli TaxID=2509675 RepID=A0A4P6JSH9_KTERU|nr:ATP-binding protein [Ktedonosporobacter rubrisoli]QBD77816.1 hypothetical protein EPA93_18175 [Ktedonosporobacter rubrisoli]
MIRRAFASLIMLFGTIVGGIVVVLILISLTYIKAFIPGISTLLWLLIALAAFIALLFGVICIIAYGTAFSTKHFADAKIKQLEVNRRRVEEAEFEALSTARREALFAGPPSGQVVDSTVPVRAVSALPSLPTGNVSPSNITSPGPGQQPGTVMYRDIQGSLKPGQFFMGIREDRTIRTAIWEEQKTVLVLGSSASGKTTTIIQMALGHAKWGAQLVVCDPHSTKPDGLLSRLAPLAPSLYPGTTFAQQYPAILHNVRTVKEELVRRIDGGSYSLPIVLIVEEWDSLMDDKAIAKELTFIVQKLGREGRGYQVYAIFAAHSARAALRESVISYVVHRVDKNQAAKILLPEYAKLVPSLPNGWAYVKDAFGATEKLQQVLVTAEDVQEEAKHLNFFRRQPVSPPGAPTPNPGPQPPLPTVADLWAAQPTAELPPSQPRMPAITRDTTSPRRVVDQFPAQNEELYTQPTDEQLVTLLSEDTAPDLPAAAPTPVDLQRRLVKLVLRNQKS